MSVRDTIEHDRVIVQRIIDILGSNLAACHVSRPNPWRNVMDERGHTGRLREHVPLTVCIDTWNRDAVTAHHIDALGQAIPADAIVTMDGYVFERVMSVDEFIDEPTCAIVVGDQVRIIGGPLRGFSGKVVSQDHAHVTFDTGASILIADPQHCHVVTSTSADTPPEHECPVCSLDARTCGHVPCTACSGTGGAACSDCKGTGEYVGALVREACETCKGAGKIVCEPCGGSGW